jgi:hypothetical protein
MRKRFKLRIHADGFYQKRLALRAVFESYTLAWIVSDSAAVGQQWGCIVEEDPCWSFTPGDRSNTVTVPRIEIRRLSRYTMNFLSVLFSS